MSGWRSIVKGCLSSRRAERGRPYPSWCPGRYSVACPLMRRSRRGTVPEGRCSASRSLMSSGLARGLFGSSWFPPHMWDRCWRRYRRVTMRRAEPQGTYPVDCRVRLPRSGSGRPPRGWPMMANELTTAPITALAAVGWVRSSWACSPWRLWPAAPVRRSCRPPEVHRNGGMWRRRPRIMATARRPSPTGRSTSHRPSRNRRRHRRRWPDPRHCSLTRYSAMRPTGHCRSHRDST